MEQKQRLAYSAPPPLAGSADGLDHLNDSEPTVRLEKQAQDIGATCQRARILLDLINVGGMPASALLSAITELHSLDQEAVGWRQTSQWAYTSLNAMEHPHLLPSTQGITDTIQLHPDVWMAYEWNYHRTARLIFLRQVLQCARAALATPGLETTEDQALRDTASKCISTIQSLADEYLATVPQSFGDVDHMGRPHDTSTGPPRCRAIGGYLLLWPTRTVRAESTPTTSEQKERAARVFERIREYTGMKRLLGDRSNVI